MEEDEIEEELERKKAELKSELKEELGAGDTRIDASLGMFNLTVDSEESLEETAEVFADIWEDRIEEVKEAESTVKRELEETKGGLFLG